MYKKRWSLTIIILVLIIVSLACGTGYTTRYKSFTNRGEIIIKAESDNGNRETKVEINEDYTWEPVTLTVTIEVQSGSYHADFFGDNGKILSLDASAGNPANGKMQMTTNSFGEVTLKTEGQDAQGIVITINYTRP